MAAAVESVPWIRPLAGSGATPRSIAGGSECRRSGSSPVTSSLSGYLGAVAIKATNLGLIFSTKG